MFHSPPAMDIEMGEAQVRAGEAAGASMRAKHREDEPQMNRQMNRPIDPQYCRKCDIWLTGREQYEDHKEGTKHRKTPEKEEDDDDKEYCPGNEGDDDDKEEKRGMKRRNTGEDSWKAGTPWDLKRPKKKARAGWRRWTLKRKYIMCQPDDRKRRPYLDDHTSTIGWSCFGL